jgi:hypothetical protein
MRIKSIGLAVASMVLALAPAKAEFVISILQEGTNVVATGSGSVNTAGLVADPNPVMKGLYDLVAPKFANIGFGVPATPFGSFTEFSGLSGPASFGSGDTKNANTTSGASFILVGKEDGQGIVDLPVTYVSKTLFTDSDTFNNATFSSLGLTVGTYTYTFGSGVNADSIVVQIGAVPEPSTWAMMILGFVGLGLMAYRRKTVALNAT